MKIRSVANPLSPWQWLNSRFEPGGEILAERGPLGKIQKKFKK